MEQSGAAQVLIATHAPLLMAYPGAELLQLGKYGLAPARLEDLDHFRLMREFFSDPDTFVATMLEM